MKKRLSEYVVFGIASYFAISKGTGWVRTAGWTFLAIFLASESLSLLVVALRRRLERRS